MRVEGGQVKSDLSLIPIPSDTNKTGSKVTRHEEPGRSGEAGSSSADVLLSLHDSGCTPPPAGRLKVVT